MIGFFLSLCLLVITLFFFHKKIQYLLYSPSYGFIYFNLIALSSSLIYHFFAVDKIMLFDVDDISNIALVFDVANSFIWAVNLFMFGFLARHFFSRGSNKYLMVTNLPHPSFDLKNKSREKWVLYAALLTFCVFAVLMFLIYGEGYFERGVYIPEGMHILQTLLVGVSLMLVVFLGVSYKTFKKVSLILFIVFILLNIPTASRKIVVYGLLYLLFVYPTWKGSLRRSKFIASIILLAILFAYVIQLRNLGDHGLLPYLAYFEEGVTKLFEQIAFMFYYVFIYGFFVAAQTQLAEIVTWDAVIVSLNPLPGVFVGWYDISHTLRLNQYAPFSAYGEIFSIGYELLVPFFFVLGAIFYSLEKSVRRGLFGRKYIRAYIVVFFSFLFVIYAYEYNLRNSTRLIYYAVFYLILLKVLGSLRKALMFERGS